MCGNGKERNSNFVLLQTRNNLPFIQANGGLILLKEQMVNRQRQFYTIFQIQFLINNKDFGKYSYVSV